MVTDTPDTSDTPEPSDGIQGRPLAQEMSSSYLDYAMSVIVSRALPDVRDGLKPVQRRILYAMDDLGMRAAGPHRKSARIVGEVLGKYHPHSDQPVYDAMVRMAQDFSLRNPLVDGQGNFGSIDNDPPAAMRYTEARLSRIAEELMADLDKNTVDFSPNFDESLNEPSVLPARIPNLLLNGADGIAVAMACKIPPHNLNEVGAAIKLLLDRPDAPLPDVMACIQGPDLPTGGILFAGEGRSDLQAMYGTGRGGVVVRGKQHLEDIGNSSRQQIVFTEIPYQVNKVRIIEQIAAQVRDKKIDGIADLRDESDRHGLRLVIELKRDAQYRSVLRLLFRATDLQIRYSGNFVALDNGRPRTLTLHQLLNRFIAHRQDIIRRRTEFDLEKARERHHIVEGLLRAIDLIDEVIATIRNAESGEAARDELQETPFEFSQRQAQAVLEMQLRRLAALERGKLEEEYKDLTETIAYLQGLLDDPKKIDAVIGEDIDELIETYGAERRTQIIDRSIETFSEADLIPHQASVIALTRRGYIKRQPVDDFRRQKRGGIGTKGTAGEDAPVRLICCDTHDYLLMFTSRGRVYCLSAHEVETRSRVWRGIPVRNVIELQLDERVTAIVPVEKFNDDYIILGTRLGKVKKTRLSNFANVRRSGLNAFNLDDGDELVEADFAHADDDVIVTTSRGQTTRFAVNMLREASRISGGVWGIRVPDDAELIGLQTVRAGADVLTVAARGFGKRTHESEYSTKGRGGKGMIGHKVSEETGNIVGAAVVTGDEELLLISGAGKIIRTALAEIRQCGRATKGVRVMKSDAGVAAIAVVDTTREFGQQRD